MSDLKMFLIMLVKADRDFTKSIVGRPQFGDLKEIWINTDGVNVVFNEDESYKRIDKN